MFSSDVSTSLSYFLLLFMYLEFLLTWSGIDTKVVLKAGKVYRVLSTGPGEAKGFDFSENTPFFFRLLKFLDDNFMGEFPCVTPN